MRKIVYAIVIPLIAAVLVAGVLLSDPSGRWFGGRTEGAPARVSQVTGDVSIYRDGMSYVLKRDVSLRQEDTVVTGDLAGCEARLASGAALAMDGDSRMALRELTGEAAEAEVLEGAVLFDTAGTGGEQPLKVRANGVRLERTEESVLSVETYMGTVTVCVFAGNPDLFCGGRAYALIPGDQVVVVLNEERETETVTVNGIFPGGLREFLLRCLIERDGLLYDAAKLRDILEQRRLETEAYAPAVGEGLACTLEIRCDTVLDHPEAQEPEGGWPFPEDGVILPPTAVTFGEGDSVFDILRRSCLSRGIPLEYSYTVSFGGYYVQMLSGLRQYDMGMQSGWMYKVNGWYPNYSCSRCPVRDGDVIIWSYSCEGLGADLGAELWNTQGETDGSADG